MTTQSPVGRTDEITARVFGDPLTEHRLEMVPDLYAEDCAFYGMEGPGAIDREGYEAFLTAQFEAFPDLSFDVEETIIDPDGDVRRSAGPHTAPTTARSATSRPPAKPSP